MTIAPAGRPDPDRREPLWTRVDRNRVRLAGFVTLFVVSAVVTAEILLVTLAGLWALLAASSTAGDSIDLVFGDFRAFVLWSAAGVATAALAWAVVAITRSERWLVERLGARIVPKGELLPTKMALKDMAIAAGMRVAPALYLLEDSSVNAFVFLAQGRRPIVGVTPGLVEKLDVDEQRAVFANLVARIASGDTIVDTGVAAMMLPLNAYQGATLAAQNRQMDEALLSRGSTVREPRVVNGSGGGSGLLLVFFFGFAMAIVSAVFSAVQRRRHLHAGEKADAEGMLLLRDPRPMLSALERCVVLDNSIAEAGETFADLFYCWPGMSPNDDSDPEWRRVARLREVLGVEGVVDERAAAVPESAFAPLPPRLG